MKRKHHRSVRVCTACLVAQPPSYYFTGELRKPRCLLLKPYEIVLTSERGGFTICPSYVDKYVSCQCLPLPKSCPKRLEHAVSLGLELSEV